MKYSRLVAMALTLLVLPAWQHGHAQTVVENPTTSQTINQPSGTTFTVNGLDTLLWPGVFRMAVEVPGTMVMRDMSQSNAWFVATKNLGSSTGDIEFFGGFTNSGQLIPNGVGIGSVGTFTNPWGGMAAEVGRFAQLSKGLGAFKIDHPLDPLNKYLQHSFVESPDMMNIYNGVVVLDKHGEAWITLPNWFQALNSDYRYQLTSIGAPGPKLHIAQEVSGNRFKIAGGKMGNKVSWQVTGIRQDAYAQNHRIQVELDKPHEEQGRLLYPDTYPDQPKDALASVPANRTEPAKTETSSKVGNR